MHLIICYRVCRVKCSSGHLSATIHFTAVILGNREAAGNLLNKQKKKKKKMQTPVIITVFSNQEVIYLLLSATHSLKVSEELAGTLGPAQTGGGSDRALQTFLLSSLVSLPLCLFLLLLFAVSPTLRPDYPAPPHQRSPPGCSRPADPVSSCQPRFPMKGLTSHKTTI